MNILIACIHYPSASGRFIQRAFDRLGHDTRSVGPSTGPQIWGLTVQDKFIWHPNVDMGYSGNVQVERVLDVLNETESWQPDLIVTTDSAFTLEGQSDAPSVVWGVDNHVRDYRMRDWDQMFLAHLFASRMDEENAHWLPCAYDPEIHRSVIPLKERRNHAVMLGVLYEQRKELLKTVAQAPGLRLVAGTGPLFEEYTEVYNSGVVSLCLSAKRDVGQRIFEGMAMGNVVLTDDCHDFAALGLEHDNQILVYESADHARALLHELITGPTERVERLVAAAKEWVEPHTWDQRAQYVLATVFGDGTE